MKNKIAIRRRDIFLVFLRSFFVQSSWNYRSLISIGFSICLIPIIRRLYKEPQERKAALNRHLQFFNAHPYMASYALGVSICMEEACASGDREACHKLVRIKELLTGILGAVGDQLFWWTIKPFSLIIGGCLLSLSGSPFEIWMALLFTFWVYNTPHFYLRYKGLFQGYRYGLEIYRYFNQNTFRLLRIFYFYIGVIAFVLFLSVLIVKLENRYFADVVIFGLCAVISGIIYHRKRNIYATIWAALSVSLLGGIVHYLWIQ